MSESQHLARQIEMLYSGPVWLDVTIMETLKSISASQAAAKPLKNAHSVWEIANHCIDWRFNLSDKLQGGSPLAGEQNYFYEVTDFSDDGWKQTLQRFEESQVQLVKLLNEINDQKLDETHGKYNTSFRDLIYGIIEHDAYHLGQMVLIKKLV